jgi:hypothetical protein
VRQFAADVLSIPYSPAENSIALFSGLDGNVIVKFWSSVSEASQSSRRRFLVIISEDSLSVTRIIGASYPLTATIADVLHDEGLTGNIRVLNVQFGKIEAPITIDTPIQKLDGDLRVDFYPDTVSICQTRFLPVFIEPSTTFCLTIVDEETIDDAITRIRSLAKIDTGVTLRPEFVAFAGPQPSQPGQTKLASIAGSLRRIELCRPRAYRSQLGIRIPGEKLKGISLDQ